MVAANLPARHMGGMERTGSQQAGVNVGDMERWLSVAGGAALGIYGLARGSLGGLALAGAGGALLYRGLTGHCSLYATLGVSSAEEHAPATSIPAGHGVKVELTITVNRPAADLFRFWRELENLPRFLRHLESVRWTGGQRSHWVAKALGLRLGWDAEIINERPDELIAWRSLPGSDVDTAGSVHFTPAPGGGTHVQVTLKYDLPAGKFGAAVARLFGQAPEQQIREDLESFKRMMESGEGSVSRQPLRGKG